MTGSPEALSAPAFPLLCFVREIAIIAAARSSPKGHREEGLVVSSTGPATSESPCEPAQLGLLFLKGMNAPFSDLLALLAQLSKSFSGAQVIQQFTDFVVIALLPGVEPTVHS